MDYVLLGEQFFNGFQLGIILFMMAAGLTLVFGIMDLVNWLTVHYLCLHVWGLFCSTDKHLDRFIYLGHFNIAIIS